MSMITASPLTEMEKKVMGMKLLQAARKDDVESVAIILAAGMDVNAFPQSKMNALLTAVNKGNYKMTNFLSSLSMTDLNAKELSDGNTPLHLACKNGFWTCVKALVASGAGVDEVNHAFDTPLVMSTKPGKADSEGFQKESKVIEMLELRDTAFLMPKLKEEVEEKLYQWENETSSSDEEIFKASQDTSKNIDNVHSNIESNVESNAKSNLNSNLNSNKTQQNLDIRHKNVRQRDKKRERDEEKRRDEIFTNIDTDGSGFISKKAFFKAKMGTLSDFEDFDEDGSGYISRFEFKRRFKIKWYNNPSIVMDCGSEITKVGMAGTYQTCIAIPRQNCPLNFTGFMPQSKMLIPEGKKSKFRFGWDFMIREVFVRIPYLTNVQTIQVVNIFFTIHGVVDYKLGFGQNDRGWSELATYVNHLIEKPLTTTANDRALIFTVHPAELPGYYEKLATVLFDEVNMPGLFLGCHSQLSLYATGRTTGCVLDCGGGVTWAAPFFDAELLHRGLRRLPFGGKRITDWLHGHIDKRMREAASVARSEGAYEVSTRVPKFLEYHLASHVKHSLCYVAVGDTCDDIYKRDCAVLLEKGERKLPGYELPDGNIIKFGNERIRGPECLFNPSLFDDMLIQYPKSDTSTHTYKKLKPLLWKQKGRWGEKTIGNRSKIVGVHTLIANAIDGIKPPGSIEEKMEIQNDLYNNIILSGGSTKFKGFQQRFSQEISAKVPLQKTNVISAPEYGAWKGGSIMGSMSTFSALCLTKQHFEEIGPHLVQRHLPF